jgi:hypothetical protein
MLERNEHGVKLEREGKIGQAIALYEQNVTARFDGPYPYERLRNIYDRRKQYHDALRVCKVFVEMSYTLQKLGAPRRDLEQLREKFLSHSGELKKKTKPLDR